MTCPYLAPTAALSVLNAAASPDSTAMQSFYSALSKQAALQFDQASGCWLAASPALAHAALEHLALGVRPPGQAVPVSLQGRPFGAVFARWLRMRDDAAREAEKRAVLLALERLDAALVEQIAVRQADLALDVGVGLEWSHWQWRSIPCTVAALLGLPMFDAADQAGLQAKLAAMALALKPQADFVALDAADQAVAELLAQLGDAADAPLAAALQTQALRLELDGGQAWWQAQALALLWQSYEAGAGLLGLALLAATSVEASTASTPDLAACAALLQAAARQPGAIHHTRRWASRDCVLAGQTLQAGEALLVLLVGSDDPQTDTQTDTLSFGSGRHRCPGIALALTASAVALWRALEGGARQQTPRCTGYQALANARIPILSTARFEQEQP
ncbi:cytochrome P450 family protein [Roseateles albus]|uniref:Cytochrome P450 n=1 Tax=Roseateles albus TaxID=2987525 RepID=A0ABT5KJV8_9BURK|nr:hypothetical protein [Roseateles albus]MDC8774219.1 hypothetical protein [Roseateles albus]